VARPCRAAGPGCLQCLHSDIVGCVPAVEVTTVDMPSRTRQPHTTGSAGVPPFCPQVIHHRQGRGAPTRVRARNFACPALLMWPLISWRADYDPFFYRQLSRRARRIYLFRDKYIFDVEKGSRGRNASVRSCDLRLRQTSEHGQLSVHIHQNQKRRRST